MPLVPFAVRCSRDQQLATAQERLLLSRLACGAQESEACMVQYGDRCGWSACAVRLVFLRAGYLRHAFGGLEGAPGSAQQDREALAAEEALLGTLTGPLRYAPSALYDAVSGRGMERVSAP